MTRTKGTAIKGRRLNRKRRRALWIRRILSVAILALSVALGVYALRLGSGDTGSVLMIVAAALGALLALGMWPRRGLPQGLCIVVGLLCLGLAAGGYVDHFYARVDGRFVPRYALVPSLRVAEEYPEHFTGMEGLETLDMRGSTVTDFTPIQALKGLKQLDLRENYAFTPEQYQILSAALPACRIRWSVPVGGAYFDSEQSEVDLTALPLSVNELKALFERYPEKRFTYLVPLLEQRYAVDVQVLDLQGQSVDAATLGEALSLLPQVRQIDLRGVPCTAEVIGSMWDAWPKIHFMFTCAVPSGTMTTEDAQVTVTDGFENLMAHLAYLPYLPNLERMDATAVVLNEEQTVSLQATNPPEQLIYCMSVYGRKISSANTELNLDNVKIASVEDVERCIALLPNVKRISMCDTGLTEEEMGRLFDTHPEIKFVWWVYFGHYRLRTDATAFTTALWDGNKYNYNSGTFAPLRYCTDLMMLDLGHNRITSIDGISGLTKLRVLILADNKISDISALENLKDLEYVELFLNDISDLTPLADKEHLVDLNLFYNPIGSGYEVLKSMTQLRRLWIGGCRLSGDQLTSLQQALPDTKIVASGRGSTGNGWREHPHYDTLVRMYDAEMYIPFDD